MREFGKFLIAYAVMWGILAIGLTLTTYYEKKMIDRAISELE